MRDLLPVMACMRDLIYSSSMHMLAAAAAVCSIDIGLSDFAVSDQAKVSPVMTSQ